MAPFYGWGSTALRLQPLRGGSLLFTIQFPESCMQQHLYEHFYSEGHNEFLGNVSISLIDKTWFST